MVRIHNHTTRAITVVRIRNHDRNHSCAAKQHQRVRMQCPTLTPTRNALVSRKQTNLYGAAEQLLLRKVGRDVTQRLRLLAKLRRLWRVDGRDANLQRSLRKRRTLFAGFGLSVRRESSHECRDRRRHDRRPKVRDTVGVTIGYLFDTAIQDAVRSEC